MIYNTYGIKNISNDYLKSISMLDMVTCELPEIDDRYNIWRVPLKSLNGKNVGEIVIDAVLGVVVDKKTTSKDTLEARILEINEITKLDIVKSKNATPKISSLCNTIGLGDSEILLNNTPSESIDLVFTSPPYFNARPEYSDYINYDEYLFKMRKIIQQCHRVLNEGRFFVINVSHVLQHRASRGEASKRIAVPFDFHQLFMEEGFDFIDDIVWVKPEGAGWATSRGRRFSADRNPLQYKAVPVTEYILVYRKKTERLIDWNINKHPNQKLVEESKIEDGYEKTNIWKICPSHSKDHPAVFPIQLADKVVKYYSFVNDVVLDPFGGIGTTAKAAYINKRRFIYYEILKEYVEHIHCDIKTWFLEDINLINWINYLP